MKAKDQNISTCKYCGSKFSKKEIKRQYGIDSMVYILDYCSARCYTSHIIKG